MHKGLLIFLTACTLTHGENWAQWRGPRFDGSSPEKNLPAKWSPTENVLWKVEMPDRSGSTPIIWKNTVFLSTASDSKIWIWALNRTNGEVLWKRHLSDGDRRMRKQNMSSPSPVTDGQWVWVMTGTGMLKALDFQGNEQWARDIQKDYGTFGLNWGYASSPLLDGNALYVQVLHGMRTDAPSYILRIDKKTGKTIWRVERPTQAITESPDSYTTPIIVSAKGQRELVVTGGDVITGHDLETGKELWRGGGFNPDNNPMQRIIASPVASGELVFAPTRVRPMIAYRAGGKGDVTGTHQAWQFMNGPDVPTPTVDGEYLYTINDRGIAYCVELKTGKEVYGGQRLRPGTYSASPTLADGKLYITSEEGVATVLRAGPKFEILAENEMQEYTLSSISVSQGNLFLRTDKHLYCIGNKQQGSN